MSEPRVKIGDEWLVLPESVPVFGEWYSVKIVGRLKVGGRDSWGECDLEKKTLIFVREFPSGASFLVVWHHEVLHAISHEGHVNHIDGDHDDDVDMAAHGLAQAFRALMACS